MTTPHLLPSRQASRAWPATGLAATEQDVAEASRIACDAPCPAARRAPRRVAEVCADDAARLALAVLRYLAAARTTREADCVEAAFAEAEAALPADAAGLFVGAMGGLLRAFEAQAGRTPDVLPASCCRATGDEEALVALLSRARAGAIVPEGRLARAACAAGRELAAAGIFLASGVA